MYNLIRPLLFSLEPERAHHATLSLLQTAHRMGFLMGKPVVRPTTIMGIACDNGVGLAAGLDKDGAYIDALGALGFGFLEIGTTTPRPQAGNDTPRLFRLTKHGAIINRMGFNNLGVDALVQNVQKSNYQGVLGINIGKNASTPTEDALLDYAYCLERVYHHASYITINISSPNTKNLRDLQQKEALNRLLGEIKSRQMALAARHRHYVPLALKVAPDLTDDQIDDIAWALTRHDIDGLIATNTTLARTGVQDDAQSLQAGGLSGAPIFELSTQILYKFAIRLAGSVDIIGAGGIDSGAKAMQKIHAGAKAVQIYSGLIYQGTALIGKCARAL